MVLQKIAVIGAGTMGHGIAQVASASGYEVLLHDLTPDKITKAWDRIAKGLDRLVAKEKIASADKARILANIKPCNSLSAVQGADLIIEAVTESEAIKLELFGKLDQAAGPEAIIATNTSSISITKLAAATKRPTQVVGMHFFNPVPVMQLVEIIKGLATSDETATLVSEVAQKMGKTPALIRDSAGFAVNRILIPMINEAMWALYEGVADAKTIDAVMKLGANHPMGPLTLADFVGLDVLLGALEVMQKNLGAEKYKPCPLLVKHVEAGYYGMKVGRGIFDYAQK